MNEKQTHIVSFITFKNNYDFESWQISNPKFRIVTVSPIFEKMIGEIYSNPTTGEENNSEFTPEFKIFVTYLRPSDELDYDVINENRKVVNRS